MKKLAIISTHPIQYYAPVFELLAKKLNVKVFYTWGESALKKFDKGFNREIERDLPLLDGYEYEFLINTAKDQGTHHFNGIINPQIVQKINEFSPDSILIYGWAWRSHLKSIKAFAGKFPILFRGDSTLLTTKNNVKSLFKMLFLRWVYRKIDIAFFVGKRNKAYFEFYGLKEKQLIFAPHAIDNKRFQERIQNEDSGFRKQLGINENDIVVLFAGKLEAIKNPLLLLAAFIQSGLTKVHLLFVGNGILENELKQKVNTQGLKNVHFINFVNQTDMPNVYQSCDLFCLPSRSETWGLAVNEAMACGKAILVSDQVGCAMDLVDETNGALFKSEDLHDLKRKLIDLTKSKKKLKAQGDQSFMKIQNWSFEKQAKAIADYVNR